jgi:hypothetical protein
MGSGGGRFARRQNSVSSASTDPSSTAFSGGAPLTHQTTQSSFTGVGAPVTNQNGVLVRETPVAESTLLTTLRDLFSAISTQPKTLGTVAPQAFINQLKRDNEFFRSTLHQDAHEFLNYLINEVAELLEKEEKKRAEEEGRVPSASPCSSLPLLIYTDVSLVNRHGWYRFRSSCEDVGSLVV